MQKIDIVISADGTIQYEVSGIKGKKCTDVTKFIDELSGNQIVDRQKTGEYCEVETDKERHKTRS